MSNTIDITALSVLAGQFPVHLSRLGFRLIQQMNAKGRDTVQYVLPPMIFIPASMFWMRSDGEYDPLAKENEFPQHAVTLAPYYIAKYPLTVAEYLCFLRATNYPVPLKGYMVTWQDQLIAKDHPVVSISWYAAKAYGQWLTHVTGSLWRLPTEAEWEKAARGIDKRMYPWGDAWDATRTRVHNGGPGFSTPVGTYPLGASPYGVMDMIGNVSEWVSTLYKPYPYTLVDEREDSEVEGDRVWRGGRTSLYPQHQRLSKRIGCRPDADDSSVSVRIAQSG